MTNFLIIKNRAIIAIIALLLTSCDTNHTDTTQQAHDANDSLTQPTSAITTKAAQSNQTQSSPDLQTPIEINWANIDSGVAPASLEDYHYPIAIDSDPVQAYAQHQGLTLAQAQHNIVLGTASNEPLLALFDELGDNYVSHSLSKGDNIALIVNTTANVKPSRFDYVIKEDFAKGLVLPIIITHDDVDNTVSDIN